LVYFNIWKVKVKMNTLVVKAILKKAKKLIKKRDQNGTVKYIKPISLKKLTKSVKHNLKLELGKLYSKDVENIILADSDTFHVTNKRVTLNRRESFEKTKKDILGNYQSSQNFKTYVKMSQEEAIQWRTKHKIIIQDPQSSKNTTDKDEPTLQIPLTTFSSFRCRQLINATLIQQCVEGKGFSKPTPVQSQCWPILLNGRDIVTISETGSGKTLAFAIPALMILATKRETCKDRNCSIQPQALILAPTRELAMQSHSVFTDFGKSLGIKSLVLCGGVPKHTQIVLLNRGSIDVIVATPGRLKDLILDECCNLSGISMLVFDEADRMLDMGFEEDVKFIIQKCPSHLSGRLTAMFSATWPKDIREMAYQYMNNPLTIYVGFDTNQKHMNDFVKNDNGYGSLHANPNVKQNIEVLSDFARRGRLCQLLKLHVGVTDNCKNRIIIFGLYKKEVSHLEIFLKRNGWKNLVTSIHGDKQQHARNDALHSFKTGTTPLLIATDVAGRGLDLPNVQLVINFTFPLTIEDYVHRIGRTGRAGSKGISYTFFQEKDREHAGELQQVLKNAGQDIPNELKKFGTAIVKRKKEHNLYGNYGPSSNALNSSKKAKRLVFNSDGEEEEK